MKTILVVDDDPISVRLIELILGRNGFQTVGAASAAEALAWLGEGHPVEMVITDQNLGGLSGLELFSAIRADSKLRGLPVILCSAMTDRATIEEALRLGLRYYIVKPINPKVLMDKVEAVLAERPRVVPSKDQTMTRLELSDAEYKALVHTSQAHVAALRKELADAHAGGDRVTTIEVAGRLREPAALLAADRLLAAIDALGATSTWHDLDRAIEVLFRELDALEVALEFESKPQLLRHPRGEPGFDRY
jgi:DNA-binding response OmpR family regulator